jgi:putative iron-regulated protein
VAHQQRRGDYLATLTDILIADLQRLQMRWAPSPEAQGYYAQLLSAATPAETLQASLLTVNRIIEQDLLQNYLTDVGSSPFSGGTPADVEAIMRGIRQVLISEDGASGLQPILTARKQEKDLTLLAEVITLTSADTACIAGWQTAASYLEGQSACRQQVLDLLITLKQINDQLGLQIPASG